MGSFENHAGRSDSKGCTICSWFWNMSQKEVNDDEDVSKKPAGGCACLVEWRWVGRQSFKLLVCKGTAMLQGATNGFQTFSDAFKAFQRAPIFSRTYRGLRWPSQRVGHFPNATKDHQSFPMAFDVFKGVRMFSHFPFVLRRLERFPAFCFFEVAHISRSLELPDIIWHAFQASSCCGSIEKAINAC